MTARVLIAIALIRRHTFDDADNRRLAHLCGPLDAHLRLIEQTLGVSLLRRDATFRVQGPGDAVDRTVALLDTMYQRATEAIGERSLQLMLLDATAAPGSTPATAAGTADEPVVLHTRHSDLSGRTPNQMQYLHQMLSHDITFGIGP
ncbi:MAG: PhoH family protein, partial [Rubrivivax sp.]|nr:PhoH family protein [Rubrivivax sp.]